MEKSVGIVKVGLKRNNIKTCKDCKKKFKPLFIGDDKWCNKCLIKYHEGKKTTSDDGRFNKIHQF